MSFFPSSPLWVTPHHLPDRLDLYLMKRGLPFSRSRIQKLILEEQIRVNGRPAKASYRVRDGDQIEICIPPPAPLELIPEAISLDVVYEDESLLIVNKVAGMVVHPAPGHDQGTLVHALLHHCKDLTGIGGRERPGIVHRLDKDTSGIMVVAKTDEAHQRISKQFKHHTIDRRYLALVCGKIAKKTGKVILPIGRDRIDRKKISSRTSHPREAETRFTVRESFRSATYLEVYPQTGRTHQIRVHLSHLGHPIIGDKVYGGRPVRAFELQVGRQMLHAERLGFIHPTTGERVTFSAPLPSDMQQLLELLQSEKGPGTKEKNDGKPG